MIVDKYVIEVIDKHLSHHYLMKYGNDFVLLNIKNYNANYDIPLYFYDTREKAKKAIATFNLDKRKYSIIKVSKVKKEINDTLY